MFRLVSWVVLGAVLFAGFEFLDRTGGWIFQRDAALRQFEDSDVPSMAMQATARFRP